jgi:D-alanyl-D-alanine carboxypeptidase
MNIKNYFGKIAFVGAITAIALLSRAVYPHLYFAAAENPSVTASPSTDAAPRFIFPALSLAAISGPLRQGGSEASPRSGEASVATSSAGPGGDLLSGSEAAPQGFVAAISGGQPSIIPLGSIPGTIFSRISGTQPPSLAVRAALVADLKTGTYFLSENATERWPLASVAKLMTATVALDKLSSAQKITITVDAFNTDLSEKTLHVGDTYTVTDLLQFLLLPSSNVAAEALAQAYGRTEFIAEMNARAAAWGMASTHYADPSGLAVGSQSTAADLVSLAQKLYADYPKILAITRTPQATVTEISLGSKVTVKNINEFSGEAGFVGGKTGYTDQADGNLLSLFLYEGHPIVIVVLGTDDGTRFTDTKALYNWFTANFRL